MEVLKDKWLLEYHMRGCETHNLNKLDLMKHERKKAEMLMKERRKNKIGCCKAGDKGILVYGFCSCCESEVLVIFNNSTIKYKIIIGIGEFSRFFQINERGLWSVEMRKNNILIVAMQNICSEQNWGISKVIYNNNRIEITISNRVMEECWISLWKRMSYNKIVLINKKQLIIGVKVFCFTDQSLLSGSYLVRLHVKQYKENELSKEINENSPYISSFEIFIDK